MRDPPSKFKHQKPKMNLNQAFEKARDEARRTSRRRSDLPQRPFPLSMVLQACPDFALYGRHGIASWRDFVSVAGVVRRRLWDEPERLGGGGRTAWAKRRRAWRSQRSCSEAP